jgi:hypothetical protein
VISRAILLGLEPFNTAVRDGSVGQKMKNILEAIKPEAACFSGHNGRRGGTLVVNIRIAMTPEDLGRSNLESLGKTWARQNLVEPSRSTEGLFRSLGST